MDCSDEEMEDRMKRIVMLCAVAFLWIAVLDVNVSAAFLKDMAKESVSGDLSGTEILETNRKQGNIVPAELAEIPTEYYSAAEQQGTLVELYYNTYESMTYDQKIQELNKRAIVYLPYGYDKGKKYNVFYLMHGGWGNETTTLGTPERPSAFKNVIDHAIESGEFDPLIIVCPTYNNTSSQDSADFSLALRLNQNYHHELLNDLIPAVEGTYSTYAKSVSPEDLMAARDYRGFGGFSMGSVATWRTFQYCLDYFRYFLPMSCGTTLDDANIFSAAEGHDQSDYFVWTITGTEDFAYSYVESRVGRMRNSKYFTEADGKGNGNFAYRVKEGYSHDGMASMEYTYNGLRLFWNWEKQMGETVPEEGHKVHTIVKVPAEEASCTEEGKTEGEYCSVCHEVLKEQEIIPAVGHSFRKVVVSASEKQNGTIITKCAKCGMVESETVIYAADRIKLSKTSCTYNGKSRKPSVNVTDSKGNVLKEGTDYTVFYPKDMKSVGTYTVTINFKNYYTGNVKRKFTIVPKPTSISKVSTNKKGITVKWKKRVNQVTGYEISYSSSSKFAKSKTTSIKVKGSKKTTKKISKIKMGKKYYVRIRTYILLLHSLTN